MPSIDRRGIFKYNRVKIKPKWRNWQTRGIQNPVRITPGEGPIPSFGTLLVGCYCQYFEQGRRIFYTGFDLMQNKILYIISKKRLTVSRIVGFLILLLLLFTERSFDGQQITYWLFKMSGLILISICSFGRLWSLIYVGGYKSNTLITEGPYSMVRNPLYFFTLLGAAVIGLVSENVLVFAVILIFYFLYYPVTIAAEEQKLADRFGQAFAEYKERVPMFIPKLSLYRAPETYNVASGQLLHNFLESLAMIWVFIFLQLIELLHNSNILPVFWKVP
jgi:protein-S-isoprenylcysteine O-methyltransferase Ste14